jgi:hypothetical protein
MKKLSYLFVVAGIFAFVACGPSAKEKEKAQRMKDSIRMDSIQKVEAAKELVRKDSIAKVEAIAAKEKAKQDSIAAASVKKVKKTVKTKTKKK